MQTRILFVCLGNICRSPLAEGICRAHAEQRGWGDWLVVDSAGTSGEHDGEAPSSGSIAVAREHGLDIRSQRSRRITRADLTHFDLWVAMDRSNQRAIERLGPPDPSRLWLQRTFDPAADHPDVPDPWSQGPESFRNVYRILDRSMPALLDAVAAWRAGQRR